MPGHGALVPWRRLHHTPPSLSERRPTTPRTRQSHPPFPSHHNRVTFDPRARGAHEELPQIGSAVYEFIEGSLAELGDDYAVVGCGGVGYRLEIPASTFVEIREQRKVRLYSQLRVRDEQMVLYGFGSLEERKIFNAICSVSKVGPGIAMAILSGIPIHDFRAAVFAGRSDVLVKIKGIGKKTAERLVLELREAVGEWSPTTMPADAPAPGSIASDLSAALGNLGFSEHEVRDAVASAVAECPEDATFDELFKVAMRVGQG